MKDKKTMSLEDNIFFAKRKIINNIYKSANLEGIRVKLEDVIEFVNNVNNGKISINDMLKLKGLQDGWKYVIDTVEEELTIDYIKKIHFEVCKGQNIEPLGEFRNKGVGIVGTSWRPKLPSECDYEKELDDILDKNDNLDRCLDLFCWIQRSQMFLDGNKRVANLVANKEMIKNGEGIIAIPVHLIGTYFTKLIDYYETGNNKELKKWLIENCIEKVD